MALKRRRCSLPAEDRFWRYVARSDGCWEWIGYQSPDGYGKFQWEGGQLAHRFAYELLVGAIPDGLTLDHLCRNRGCVNPAHLEPVTQTVNKLRGVSFVAQQAAQTHCKRGHLLSGDNVRLEKTKRGWSRRCKTCQKAYLHDYHQNRKPQ